MWCEYNINLYTGLYKIICRCVDSIGGEWVKINADLPNFFEELDYGSVFHENFFSLSGDFCLHYEE